MEGTSRVSLGGEDCSMAGIYSRVVSMATVSWEQEQGQVEEHRACGSTFIYGALHAAAAQTAETEVGGGGQVRAGGVLTSPLCSVPRRRGRRVAATGCCRNAGAARSLCRRLCCTVPMTTRASSHRFYGDRHTDKQGQQSSVLVHLLR